MGYNTYYHWWVYCSKIPPLAIGNSFRLVLVPFWYVPILFGAFPLFWHHNMVQADLMFSLPQARNQPLFYRVFFCSRILARITHFTELSWLKLVWFLGPFFFFWEWYLESIIWMLDGLIITKASLFLGILSEQRSLEIYIYIYHAYTHIYIYLSLSIHVNTHTHTHTHKTKMWIRIDARESNQMPLGPF